MVSLPRTAALQPTRTPRPGRNSHSDKPAAGPFDGVGSSGGIGLLITLSGFAFQLSGTVIPLPRLHGEVPGVRLQFDLMVLAGLGFGRRIADLVLQAHVVGDLRVDEIERRFVGDGEDASASRV